MRVCAGAKHRSVGFVGHILLQLPLLPDLVQKTFGLFDDGVFLVLLAHILHVLLELVFLDELLLQLTLLFFFELLDFLQLALLLLDLFVQQLHALQKLLFPGQFYR